MEYRKLISFGKNSFVVSLPKSWVVQSKLKKGDLIYIDVNDQNLILSKNETNKVNLDKVQTINIDGKPLNLIAREVNAAYISNCRTIILKGNDIKDKIKNLQSIFQNLIALEVMEQTSSSIIAKDFLNIDQVSVDELIRKMDIITRTMLKESAQNIYTDNYENINQRDKDVNRLYFLLYRTVLYNMENLSNAYKKLKLSPVDLLNYLFAGFYIEGIADEARRTARYSRLINVDNKEKAMWDKFFERIIQYYIDTTKSVYNKDYNLALNLSSLKEGFNKELDVFDKRNSEVNFVTMSGRVRRMLSYIHSLGRIVYENSSLLENSKLV